MVCRKVSTRGQTVARVGYVEARAYAQAGGRWGDTAEWKRDADRKRGTVPTLIPVDLKNAYRDLDDWPGASSWPGWPQFFGAEMSYRQHQVDDTMHARPRMPYQAARTLVRNLKLSLQMFPSLEDKLRRKCRSVRRVIRGRSAARYVWSEAAVSNLLPKGVRGFHSYSGQAGRGAGRDPKFVSARDFIGWAGIVEHLFPGLEVQDNSRAMDAHHEYLVEVVARVARRSCYELQIRKRGLFHGLSTEELLRKQAERKARADSLGDTMAERLRHLPELFRRLQEYN